jgi:hypothetical protein
MPQITLDLTGVETYDNLPISKYYGSIDKIEYREATEPGKFAQLMITYMVIEGELVGRKTSEFLSLSPKAAFRLKKWLNRFGIEDDLVALDVDEDTNLLMEPDLIGINVIFEVYQDPKLYQGERQIRTRLLEVVDEEPEPAPPPKKKKPAPAPVAVDAEEIVPDEDDDEDEDEEEEEEVPVQKPKRVFSPNRPMTPTGPARRTLK